MFNFTLNSNHTDMKKQDTDTQNEKAFEEYLKVIDSKHIILHNDDVNTFDHVIQCLVQICKHQPTQAEQCAQIVHHKGKCDVKSGTIEVLEPIAQTLLRNKLSVTIE